MAGALGAGKAGGGRRGALLALAGSMIGGILGMILGLPIPLVGSMLASVFFAALGAMAGAAIGEFGREESGHELEDRQSGVLGAIGGYLGQDNSGCIDDRGRRRGNAAVT